MTSSTDAAATDGTAAATHAATRAWDARPGGWPRALVGSLAAVICAFLHIVVLLVILASQPSKARARQARLAHGWGRLVLALLGIRLELHGVERLAADGPAIVMFNHESVIDIAVLARLMPPRGTVIYKQEFERIPAMGRLLAAMGFIAIDRSDRRRAIESVRTAARRVVQEADQVLIAPEGTRSREGGLLPFKRGPFHLAAETHAPVVPMVMRGMRQLMPKGGLLAHSGRLRVDVLPPIDTSDWSIRRLDEHAAEVRALYLRYVAGVEERS